MIYLPFVLVPILLFVVILKRRHVEARFRIFSSAGRWEEALPYAEALAGQWSPGLVRGRRQQNLGNVLLKLRRFDEARTALVDALATQESCGDPHAALTHASLAWLALADRNAEKAREHARAIAASSLEEVRPRARTIEAAALLVLGQAKDAREVLAPEAATLKASKRPGDMTALAVLAAAHDLSGEPEVARELAGLVRERLPEPQRKELAAQVRELEKIVG